MTEMYTLRYVNLEEAVSSVSENRLPTMFLVICATELELQALFDQLDPVQEGWISLVTGVGPIETVLRMTQFFESRSLKDCERIHAVLNFGVAGAYVCDGVARVGLLDICLAEEEVLGDLGISYPDRIEALDKKLLSRQNYELDTDLLNRARFLLRENNIPEKSGTFVTVCGLTATEARGSMLGQQYSALCENMEGAAVARVCREYHLPLLELRAISNYVEQRDVGRWKLPEACAVAGNAVAVLLRGMTQQ